MKWGWKRENGYKKLYIFGIPVYKNTNVNKKLDEAIFKLKSIYIPAATAHKEIFQPYRNCHAGQDIVLVASGPSLDSYTPIANAIHIGVNRTFQAEKLSLDYLVALDNFGMGINEQVIQYRPYECTKFFGYNYTPHHKISNHLEWATNAKRFYYEFFNPNDNPVFPYSLEHSPLVVMDSTVIAAMQIALWMGPKRIFLVGCDCSTSGYFLGEKSDIPQILIPRRLIAGWNLIKQYAQQIYPNTEIISINPVGLKGMFTDARMQNGRLEIDQKQN